MEIYWLVPGVLAVWRVTHLLTAEDGPWDTVVRLRRAAGSSFLGKLLDCFHCLSLWTAVPPAWLLGHGWMERIILWLAFSGGAILLERVTRREFVSPPALYYEDKEDEHAVLRAAEAPVPGNQIEPPAA